MAFDNVVAAGSAETLLVLFFFSFSFFYSRLPSKIVIVSTCCRISLPSSYTTTIIKSFFTTWWKKHTRNMPHAGKEAPAFCYRQHIQDRQLSPIRSFESLKINRNFPLKKQKKQKNKKQKSLIIIFIPSAAPTEKEKKRIKFPNIISWLLVIGIIPLISKLMKLIVKHGESNRYPITRDCYYRWDLKKKKSDFFLAYIIPPITFTRLKGIRHFINQRQPRRVFHPPRKRSTGIYTHHRHTNVYLYLFKRKKRKKKTLLTRRRRVTTERLARKRRRPTTTMMM